MGRIFERRNSNPKTWLIGLLVWAILNCSSTESSQNLTVNIGVMLSSENLTTFLQDHLQIINRNTTASNASLKFKAVSFPTNDNPIRAALDLCENILSEKVYVVLVDEEASMSDAVIGISYTCGFFNVPVVGIGVREAIFSDRVRILLDAERFQKNYHEGKNLQFMHETDSK